MASKSIKVFILGLGLLVSSSIEARIILVSGHTGTDRFEIVKGLAERMPEAKLYTNNLYEWSKLIEHARDKNLIASDVNLDQEGRVLLADAAYLAAREMIKGLDQSAEEAINVFRAGLDWTPWIEAIKTDAQEHDVIVGAVLGPVGSQKFGEALATVETDALMVQAYSSFNEMDARLEARNSSGVLADQRRMVDVLVGFLGLYNLEDRVSPCAEDPSEGQAAVDTVSTEALAHVLDVMADEPDDFLSLPKKEDQDALRATVAEWMARGDGTPFYLKHKVDKFYNSSETTAAAAVDEIVAFVEASRSSKAAQFNTTHNLWGWDTNCLSMFFTVKAK